METQNNVQKNWRTRQQKDELIHLFQKSGQTRKQFCEEQEINYYTFGTWREQKKKKKPVATQDIKKSKFILFHLFLRRFIYLGKSKLIFTSLFPTNFITCSLANEHFIFGSLLNF